MPRHSLGANAPNGESRVIRLRISEAEEQALRAAIRKGETLSELVRLAGAKEVRRRNDAGTKKHNEKKESKNG